MRKPLLIFSFSFLAIVVFLSSLFFKNKLFIAKEKNRSNVIRVLTYSTFLKEWGPGMEMARMFQEETGLEIEWVEVQNAGLLLENLSTRTKEETPDLVIGLDLLSLAKARRKTKWQIVSYDRKKIIKDLSEHLKIKDFIPYDWSPMTFLFKRSDFIAPTNMDDLLNPEYANSIALQDPRTSSSGFYFLIWMASLKGKNGAFEFLKKLKPSIRVISPSWSAAYSLFQNNQVPVVFSYFTSTIYHYVKESDYRYQPVYFDEAHIYSMEFAGVPNDCVNCEGAHLFANFLLSERAQKIIMTKNYMLPVTKKVKDGTPFDFPKNIRLIEPDQYQHLIDEKDKLLATWEELNL